MNHEKTTIGDIILSFFALIGIWAALYLITSACGLYN